MPRLKRTFSLYLVVMWAITGEARNAEDRLFAWLFKENEYDRRSRPVLNTTQPVTVSFRYDFMQLFEVNERSQTVCILGQIYQVWGDYRLFWNASKFDGMSFMTMDSHLLWIPDTTLINTAEMYRPVTEDVQKALVAMDPNSSTGIVTYFYNTRHTIGCRFDMRYFPFDTQNCTFIFSSWTHDTTVLEYVLPSNVVTQEVFQPSDIWTIISFDITTRPQSFECCPHPFAMIYARLLIKRKVLYYIFNLIIPTVVIKLLSSFSLFASQGTLDNLHDKLQIGITTLLSYCILLLTISEEIPKGSTSVPLLVTFYVIIMIQNAAELCVSIYLCYPNRRNGLQIGSACSRKPRVRAALKHKAETATADRNDDNRTPTAGRMKSQLAVEESNAESICMIVSLLSTVLVAGGMFAMGLTR